MNKKNIGNILIVSLICMACFFLTNKSAFADAESKKLESLILVGEREKGRTMQDIMKMRGLFYGESGNCMYTYTNHNKEIKIIGFKLKAKKVEIPAKIHGKKVTSIELFRPGEVRDPLPQVEYMKIPRCVKEISMVFKHKIFSYQVLPKLKKYNVSSKNKYFKSKDGILFSKNGRKLLDVPRRKKATNYLVPYGVKSISDHCFADCYRIKAVTMSDTVERVGEQGFIGSGIKKIRFSRNLKFIGKDALYLTKLTEVVFPGSLEEIPESCLGCCKNLKKVTIRPGVKRIGRYAFVRCGNLKKVIIPPSVKKFYVNAFVYTSESIMLKQLTIYVKKTSYAYKRLQKWKKEYKYKIKAY